MIEKWKHYPPQKPVKPDDESCCGGGCSPCVFDNYYNQCFQYKLYQKYLEQENDKKGHTIKPPPQTSGASNTKETAAEHS